MYLIGIVNEAGDLTVQTGTQVFRRTKQAAIKEYWKMVSFALAGETVICYDNDMMKDYVAGKNECEHYSILVTLLVSFSHFSPTSGSRSNHSSMLSPS